MKKIITSSLTLQALSVLLLALVCLTIAPKAQAQASGITSITNVQYASQAVLQNGVAQVTVSFAVYFNYYYNPQGYLVFAIYDTRTSNPVKGLATATPSPCQSLVGSTYVDSAVCAVIPASPSGTEYASFSLTFTSPQLYDLSIRSFIWDTRNLQAGNQLSGSANTSSVTISVTGQAASTSSTTTSATSSTSTSSTITTPSTTFPTTSTTSGSITPNTPQSTSGEPAANYTEPLIVIALIVALAAAIIFVASRRRTARPTTEKRGEGTRKPSGSFCINCGTRLPEGSKFCGKCGAEQR